MYFDVVVNQPMDKTAFTIYLVILVLSPLLFGAVHTYAYTIMSMGVLSATLLLVIKNIRKDPKSGAYQFQFPNTTLNFAFYLLLVFLIFQVIPLPDSLLGFLSPEAKVVGQKSLPASGAVIADNQSKGWCALSPYYYPVRMSIIRFAVYGLFFLGLTRLLNSQRRIELTIFLILLTGCFEALYGLAQAYSVSGHIWWCKKVVDSQDVTGTYINRSHFAGLMEMGLLLAASYSAGLSARKKKRKTVSEHKSSLRGRISRFLSGEQRFNKRALILFAGAVMGIGLVFSASRGGIIAAAGAMLCMSLFFIFRKGHRRKGSVLLFLFMIISGYALHIGVEYPIGRFKSFDTSLETRSRLAKKTMDMFWDYKLAGIGVGNFQYAYPKYQSAEDKKVFIRHAHHDWAQFLAEGGITGFSLLMVGIFYFVYRTIRLWKKRSDPFAVCLGATPLATMAAVAIHSVSDFNLHIPANFLMLVAIMAIGYSALHLERHHGADRSLYRYHVIPLKCGGIVVLLMVLGLVTWNGFWTIRHFMAEVYCNTVHNSTLNRDQNPPLAEIKKAISWDRWNAEYWYKLARELTRMRIAECGVRNTESAIDSSRNPQSAIRNAQPATLNSQPATLNSQPATSRPQPATRNEQRATSNEQRATSIDNRQSTIDNPKIISALEQAVALNPFRAQYHLRLGWEYTYLWQEPDYRKKWLPAADLSMKKAAYFAGEKNPPLHVTIGNYWVWRSKTVHPINPEWQIAWARACRHYKKAQSLERRKSLTDEIEKFVWKFYPDKEMVHEVHLSGRP